MLSGDFWIKDWKPQKMNSLCNLEMCGHQLIIICIKQTAPQLSSGFGNFGWGRTGLHLSPGKVIAVITVYAEEMADLQRKQGKRHLVDEAPESGGHSYQGCHLTPAR